MELRLRQGEDYYRAFTWYDDYNEVAQVINAYMQAVDEDGNKVLDLRWFFTVPDEATIVELPEIRRGYLSPEEGKSLLMHISNKNPLPSGEFKFDVFVQDAVGDWRCLTSGVLFVEASVSVNPND